MQNSKRATCYYHTTDAVSEVELGEQVFTVTRQDDVGLDACGMPHGGIPTCRNTVLKILHVTSLNLTVTTCGRTHQQ